MTPNNKISAYFVLLAPFAIYSVQAKALPAPESLEWKSITFGQSTDVNFASNVLPEKVGLNQVTDKHGNVIDDRGGKLITPVTLESRGGKIANSHDGLTYYYTWLPAKANMVLEADVTVNQFGPENGAKPAAQEGAGLLVRDVLGKPRLAKLEAGYEEFPAASNMVMNAIMTQDRKSHHMVQMALLSRNGVENSWGNSGIAMERKTYQPNVNIAETPRFRLRLTRTNDGFTTAWAPQGSDNWVSMQTDDAARVTQLDKNGYYVGFFASRNARITIEKASLTLSEHRAAVSSPFVAAALPLNVEIASPALSAASVYHFQLRSDKPGKLNVSSNGVIVAANKTVAAGEMQSVTVKTNGNPQEISWRFTADNGEQKSDTLNVSPRKVHDTRALYASPSGKPGNNGTEAQPLDVATAAALLAPGGTLWLADGEYSLTTLSAAVSGSPDKPKKLRPSGKGAVFMGLKLEASYWDIQGITVTQKSFHISGSHNVIDRVVAHHADDTGIWVASPAGIGRPLWASYNIISNSESYGNRDPGMINADGFAVKMRVGDGNKLIGCFAHNNIDDGYDLFNKIEDGQNGVVIIENSIALRNGNNGFKLGGEGLPVAHEIINSVAIENGMDGFTDNFNPGALKVSNNIAIDNKRFNYLFRPGPYTTADKQGVFEGNISTRTKPAEYADAVTGNIGANNAFH